MKTQTKLRRLCLALLAAAAVGVPGRAHAVFTLTLSETGNNVTLTGTGTINTAGLSPLGNLNDLAAEIGPSSGILLGGPATSTTGSLYRVSTGPAGFGSGSLMGASSGSGSLAGLLGGYVALPVNYVSGSLLSNTATFNDTTFAKLGFTPGLYNYTLPNGDRLSIISVVPEPSTWALLGLGVVGLGIMTLRRRQSGAPCH